MIFWARVRKRRWFDYSELSVRGILVYNFRLANDDRGDDLFLKVATQPFRWLGEAFDLDEQNQTLRELPPSSVYNKSEEYVSKKLDWMADARWEEDRIHGWMMRAETRTGYWGLVLLYEYHERCKRHAPLTDSKDWLLSARSGLSFVWVWAWEFDID